MFRVINLKKRAAPKETTVRQSRLNSASLNYFERVYIVVILKLSAY